MKINKINIENFVGAKSVNVTLDSPVSIFAGTNAAGKSSVQEAIRMALTGESVRVGMKKDYGALVYNGQKSGFSEVFGADDGNDFSASIVLPSGKGQHCDNGSLAFVLDAQRFAKLSGNERRSFLFGLMGVDMDAPAIKQRLIDKGCAAEKVDQIAPILRAGFEAASKEAASKARDAKASWKTATGGETWGKEKSAKWQPAPLPVDAGNYRELMAIASASLIDADKQLSAAQVALGVAEAEQRHVKNAVAERAELAGRAEKLARIEDKLGKDESAMLEWQDKVNDLRGSLKSQQAMPCPDCGVMLVVKDGGFAHAEPTAKSTGDEIAKLHEYERALSLLKNSVENGKRDLDAALKASAQLAKLDTREKPDVVDVSTQNEKVAELTEQRNALRVDFDKLRSLAEQYERRQATIEQAAMLHADVIEWGEIADALAPDGIPSELLAEALGPINDRLEESSEKSEWLHVNVQPDMSIFAAYPNTPPRPYALLSESEKWRADAMIAEAVSHISGVKLLVLDRFDVLDLNGRSDLVNWLDTLAERGDIETALIFGTLKSIPAPLPKSTTAFWIENGVVSIA